MTIRLNSQRKLIFIGVGLLCIVSSLSYLLLKTRTPKDEAMARKTCSACHLFPEPNLADKRTWVNSILPRMATLMKLETGDKKYDSMNSVDFALIINYYRQHAPEFISPQISMVEDTLTQFTPIAVNFKKELVTLIQYDSTTREVYMGDGEGWFYITSHEFKVKDSVQLTSAPVWVESNGNTLDVLSVGSLIPEDDYSGRLSTIDKQTLKSHVVLDSLQRPVFFRRLRRSEGSAVQYLVSSFGHSVGSLSLYSPEENKKEVWDALPGAIKTVEVDWDHDGLDDVLALMAQGDERLLFFKQLPDGKYSKETLLRFPPIYGSSNFSVVDFDKDNQLDILCTNGDNADFSQFTKPYHGVTLYRNNKGSLQEVWSFKMPGAWDAKMSDFDGDGDLDISAISFFPDNETAPEQNFIYFENDGSLNFRPYIHPATQRGKWIVMEQADIDDDGDEDIILGSFQYRGLGSNFKIARKDQVQVLLLENKGKR